MRQKEYDPFINFAIDKTGNYVEYEDYVAKLIDENERHLEMLLKDFEEFAKKWESFTLLIQAVKF